MPVESTAAPCGAPDPETVVLFARRVAHVGEVTRVDGPDAGTQEYQVSGELSFASSNDLDCRFDYARDPQRVVIDLTDAHVWDASIVAALDAITHRYATRGTTVEIVGLAGYSADRFERHTGRRAGPH